MYNNKDLTGDLQFFDDILASIGRRQDEIRDRLTTGAQWLKDNPKDSNERLKALTLIRDLTLASNKMALCIEVLNLEL